MGRKIGEIIEIEGKKYRCMEGCSCRDCALDFKDVDNKDFCSKHAELIGFCARDFREDKIRIIFTEVKRVMDFNLLKNYTSFTKGVTLSEERLKIREEAKEFLYELKNGNKMLQISEGLDVITAMFNYLFMLGLSEKEFQEHIDKLDRYKKEKYQ